MPDGARLALARWLPPGEPRAVILALHGFGDSGALTFAAAAVEWTRQGIAVFAPDQRGFGANPSRRDWPGADQLAADATALAADLRARYPGRPLTVVGHSMGGGVALIAAARGLPADRLVLAGPAIAGGEAIGPLARGLATLAARTVPERRWTGQGFLEIRPTDNLDALAQVAADPRSFGDAASREIRGLIEVMDRAAAAAPANRLPTLTLMGAHDVLLAPADVARVAAAMPCRAGFLVYPEGWHWLFQDLQAPRVWSDVAAFARAGRVTVRDPAACWNAPPVRNVPRDS